MIEPLFNKSNMQLLKNFNKYRKLLYNFRIIPVILQMIISPIDGMALSLYIIYIWKIGKWDLNFIQEFTKLRGWKINFINFVCELCKIYILLLKIIINQNDNSIIKNLKV